jgi:N-ethylmaleimide reductase
MLSRYVHGRAGFDGLFILSSGFDRASAEQALLDKRGELIALGRPLLANPDLVARMRQRLSRGHVARTRRRP